MMGLTLLKVLLASGSIFTGTCSGHISGTGLPILIKCNRALWDSCTFHLVVSGSNSVQWLLRKLRHKISLHTHTHIHTHTHAQTFSDLVELSRMVYDTRPSGPRIESQFSKRYIYPVSYTHLTLPT